MRLLLDTHIWLWSLLKPDLLSNRISKELENDSNELWLSPISVWETLVLSEKGKLVLRPDPLKWIHEALYRVPIKEAPINHEVAIKSRKLNLDHQDPADRFIAATACVFELTLVTVDKRLKICKEYSVITN